MAMKIRLARGGSKKRPHYSIVASDSRMPRDGRFLEKLGTYNPLLAKDDENRVKMDMDRVKHWLGQGAQPTDRIARMLEAAGVIEGYAAILSEKALGRSATVFVAVTLEDQRRETMAKFERAVALCREVQDCHLMTGESDYLLRIVIADDDRYERIHQDTLSRLPGVRRLVSNFTIRTVFRRAASVAH